MTTLTYFLTMNKQTTVWRNGVPMFSGTVENVGTQMASMADEFGPVILVKFTTTENESAPSVNHQIAVKRRRCVKLAKMIGRVVSVHANSNGSLREMLLVR